MTNLTIFYVVFISQILLLTVYFPTRLIKRMQFIQKNCPESSHPKLYPKSAEYYQKMSLAFGVLNILIFILGGVILYYIYEGSLVEEDGVNQMLPWYYFMIQMSPTWMLHFFGFKTSKLMKQADTRTQKSAKLAPRKLFQYVSPMLVVAVIVAYIVFVMFAFYLEDFSFELGGKAFMLSIVLFLGYVFFFITTIALIYGKKADPYQSQEDRTKAISNVVKTNCFTLIGCVIFMAFAAAVGTYNLKSVMPIGMSLFLQFIVVISMGYVLKKCQIEDIDFDVYKANTATGDKP